MRYPKCRRNGHVGSGEGPAPVGKLLGVLAGVVLVCVALWTATRKILAVIGNRREARIHREMARAITTRLEAIERDDTVHSAATVGAAQPKS